jgi:hypothetical protein
VEAFELFDDFGVMSNVSDPRNLVANAGGVALGLGVDVVSGAKSGQGVDR